MRFKTALSGCLLLLAVAASPAAADTPDHESVSAVSPGASSQVSVSGNVYGVRVLVVDEAGELAQVWSNTDAPALVKVSRGGVNGPELPMTTELSSAYERIAPAIVADARGLVYERPRA